MILSPTDQAIYDQGFKFVPQSQYLLGAFAPTNLDMTSSGIAGIQQPFPYPPLPVAANQGGGSDGSGGFPGGTIDQGLTSADDFGMGIEGNMGLTDEEKEALDRYNNPQLSNVRGFTTAGLMSLGFLDPFTAFGTLISQRNKQKNQALKDLAGASMRAEEGRTADRARAANPDVYARADAMGFTDGKGGGFGSKSTGTNEAFSNETGRGRTGYLMGGLTDLVDIYD